MADKISKEEVEKVAQLARLELSEAEVQKYQKELSAILGYIEILDRIDTDKVQATEQVTGLSDVFAVDSKNPSFPREEILKNAPEKKNGFIKVKRVFE